MSAQLEEACRIGMEASIADQSPKLSPEKDKRTSKRPRASKPKVKSGCITCKTRRVKCDETKPHCVRCQKFGRLCDGYVTKPTPVQRAQFQLQPILPLSILYTPSVSIHGTEEESRYFQIYVERAAYELCGFFEEGFWTRIVPQESHKSGAIRHAAIALGAMKKGFEIPASATQLKVNIIQRIDKKHHEQAVSQYLKAIKALNQHISDGGPAQIRSALIACLLFICFEIYQGSIASTIQQIFSGMKLLRSYYLGTRNRAGSQACSKIPRLSITSLGVSQLKNTAINETLSDHEPHTASNFEAYPDIETESCGLKRHSVDSPQTGKSVRGVAAIQVTEPNDKIKANNDSLQPRSSGTSRRASAPPSILKNDPPKKFLSVSNPSRSRRNSITPPRSTTPIPILPAPQPTQGSEKSPQGSSALKRDLQVEDVLVQMFMRRSGAGHFLGIIPSIPPYEWDVQQQFNLPIPQKFATFTSAQLCWDFLMNRSLEFYSRTLYNRHYAPHKQETLQEITHQYNEYMAQLSSFERAFQHILNAATSPTGAVTHAPSLVLSMYHKCTTILLSQVLYPSETIYDTYHTSFSWIVYTCSRLIAIEDLAPYMPRNRRFTFEHGIIPPLHFTATKCRDPAIRRQAIHLLFVSPRQEGMWDSLLCARISRWLMTCEEEGLDMGDTKVLRMPSGEIFSGSSAAQDMASKGLEVDDCETLDQYPEILLPSDIFPGIWESGRRVDCEIISSFGFGDDSLLPNSGFTTPTRLPHSSVSSDISSWLQLDVEDNESWLDPLLRNRGSEDEAKGWFVPEANRVSLSVISWHVPERYVVAKCQRVGGEEREKGFGW